MKASETPGNNTETKMIPKQYKKFPQITESILQ